MAHELNFSQSLGRYAAVFGSGQGAWHNEGLVVDGLMTMREVVGHIGLDKLIVETRPFYDAQGNETGFFGIMRLDTMEYIAKSNESYGAKILQFHEILSFVDDIIGSSEGAHYETAGLLGKGEKFWCLARIPQFDFTIGSNDPHVAYLLAVGSHDGSTATTCKIVYERVVCNNTLAIALKEKGKEIRIKHQRHQRDKMQTAVQVMQGLADAGEFFQDRFNLLAETQLNSDKVAEILDKLYPPKKAEEGKKTVDTRRQGILAEIMANYNKCEFENQKGTGFNLLNAITDYMDHSRVVRNTTGIENVDRDLLRVKESTFGSSADLKEQAFEVLVEVCQAEQGPAYVPWTQRTTVRLEAERAQEQGLANSGLLDTILDLG